MSARARVALLAASVSWLVTSCGGDARAASWRIRFESDGGIVAAGAVRVHLRVLAGGCDATAVVYQADVSRTEVVPLFGEIGSGAFAFEAVARDATCTIVARGCTAKSLPLADGDEVVTQLVAVSGEAPLCAPSDCTEGICAPGSMDAGVADAM